MKNNTTNKTIIIRGAGEMASGVIHKLHNSGYNVIALEQPNPVCVRRLVCFANAFYEQTVEIEGIESILVKNIDEALRVVKNKKIPLLIDPDGNSIEIINPIAVIDGRMFKKENIATSTLSTILIGLGPGFNAGKKCNAVVETNRGVDLGKVIYNGNAEKFTGIPAEINNYTTERVLRAPTNGKFISNYKITDIVKTGDVIGEINGEKIFAQIDGMIRGLIHNSVTVKKRQKIGDIDPRENIENCFKISDKAIAIGNGVLEALLYLTK